MSRRSPPAQTMGRDALVATDAESYAAMMATARKAIEADAAARSVRTDGARWGSIECPFCENVLTYTVWHTGGIHCRCDTCPFGMT